MPIQFALDKNVAQAVFTSAARTATSSVDWAGNMSCKGIELFIDVTAAAGMPSVVFTINNLDPNSGKTRTIITSAAITGTGTTILRVYPGVTTSANLAVSDFISPFGRITATHANTDSITYSVTANFIR